MPSIVDATLIAAPKQRNTQDEKDATKAGKAAQEVWPNAPAKVAQKDVDARWPVKFAKARTADNRQGADRHCAPELWLQEPCRHRSALRLYPQGCNHPPCGHDGSQLREVVTTNNTASDVWADTAYRSKTNEGWLAANGRVSRIHRKKPKAKPRSEALRAANRAKSKIWARVEHVFAQQRAYVGLFLRTIGLKLAGAKIMLANLTYNMQRLIFHERRAATG